MTFGGTENAVSNAIVASHSKDVDRIVGAALEAASIHRQPPTFYGAGPPKACSARF